MTKDDVLLVTGGARGITPLCLASLAGRIGGGTDFLLGTYVPVATWTKKMRAVPGADATERWGVPVEPLGVPQAPIIGVGQATIEDLTPTALIDAPPESSFDGVVVPTQPATVAGGAALA